MKISQQFLNPFGRQTAWTFTFILGMTITSLEGADKKKPWYDQPQPRFAKTDLGRVFSGTVDLRDSGHPATLKGMAVQVGDSSGQGPFATILFDSELLRYSAAIPTRPLMFNTYRDGLGGSGHWMGPPYIFTTRREPGWAKNNSFKDPRPKPHGPLPRDWAHYQGMYRHGKRAMFAYTVGPVGVLDSPWVEGTDTLQAVSRNLTIAPSDLELTIKLLDAEKNQAKPPVQGREGRSWLGVEKDGQITAVGLVLDRKANHAARLAQDGQNRVVLQINPEASKRHLKILYWTGSSNDLQKFLKLLQESPAPENMEPLKTPGPAQWTESLVTRGRRGLERGAYTVDTITPPYKNPYNALMTFGGHDFFGNGDAAICTIHGDVWRVTGLDDSLKEITWHRYATGLFQPLGLKIVKDKVYVLGRDQITRLHDLDGNHEADYYENFNNDCKIGKHVHEFTTSLETDPDGNFYYNKGNNGGQTEHDGSLVRVSADGKHFDIFATGFRWPNGGGAGPDGTITVADQQGTWVPASRLDVVSEGGFYGYIPAHHRSEKPDTYDGPLCWIPHNVDNSCGGQTWVTGNQWGPLENKMLHLSYGKCEMFLVLEESIDGVRQAGVVNFGVKFDSGAMRARFNPKDGQLYVSGLRGWQTSATKDGCFQRVRYTGKPLEMPTGLNIHENGVHIHFPHAIDRELALDSESWAIEQWNYRWTGAYGSKEYKVSNPEETGHDSVEVENVSLSEDGRTAFLKLPNLGPVMQMKIRYNMAWAGGKKLQGSIHNTIHRLGPAFKP